MASAHSVQARNITVHCLCAVWTLVSNTNAYAVAPRGCIIFKYYLIVQWVLVVYLGRCQPLLFRAVKGCTGLSLPCSANFVLPCSWSFYSMGMHSTCVSPSTISKQKDAAVDAISPSVIGPMRGHLRRSCLRGQLASQEVPPLTGTRGTFVELSFQCG